MVQRSWNMHRDSDETAQKLASAVELRLAEYSSGHLDEQSLRKEFEPFVTRFSAQISSGEVAQQSYQNIRRERQLATPQLDDSK